MFFLFTLNGSSPRITISASLPGSRVPFRFSSKDSSEGVKSTLDSCEAQGLFLGFQNLQNCDQILIQQFYISTTAGGEGINLQVCHILFNYDLPWNPMALEQRIGRIHRYGQVDTSQVYNLVGEDTVRVEAFRDGVW